MPLLRVTKGFVEVRPRGLESPPYNPITHQSGNCAALDTGTSVCAVFITIARKV